jgi:chromosome segregation ATPase
MEVDRRETQLREKGRDSEIDKSILNNQLKEREAAIEKLTKMLEDTMAELTTANTNLAEKESLVENMEADLKRMTDTTEKAQQERDEAVEKMEGMDEKIKDSTEVIQLMRDENRDLYQR